MTITDTVKPVAIFKPGIDGLDNFDQAARVTHLREFAEKIGASQASYPIGLGVLELLKLDLLRYGNVGASKSGMSGFCVIRDSNPFRDFVYSRVLPEDFIAGFLLIRVSYGLMALDVTDDADVPDFTFAPAGGKEVGIEEICDDCERRFIALGIPILGS